MRVVDAPDGLVRVVLKKPFSDGTVAVDRDPLSLLCRLAATVPPPRFRTVRYIAVLTQAIVEEGGLRARRASTVNLAATA